jgi:glucokinase
MARFILAIDLGGTKAKIGLVSLSGKVFDRTYISTRSYARSKESLVTAIVESSQSILKNNKLAKKDLYGAGIGAPGPVDFVKGIVHFLPNIPGWKNTPLKKILQKRLGLPVLVDNDVNLMCLAEWKLGAGRKARNILCITLGTGVGGGLVIDGKLFRGPSFSAGEVGHIPLNEKGPGCNCGGFACLERYVGNDAILKAARRIFRDSSITLEELSNMALQDKNIKAIRLWQEVGQKIGIALAGVVNVVNPEIIVIGGGVANAGKYLFTAIRETVSKRAMSTPAGILKIRKAELGDDAGLIGAMLLVKENLEK